MGLVAVAMNGLRPCPLEPEDSTDGLWYAHPEVIDFTERNWRGFTRGIRPDTYYSFNEARSFQVGAAAHFNEWRAMLREMVHDLRHASDPLRQPFAELLSFADNDGIIGTEVAQRLSADFLRWEATAKAFAETHEDGLYFLSRYAGWRAIIDTAADGGAVEFC